MNKNKQLYFVALIPPEPIYGRVQNLKEEVYKDFGSKAALRSPPHITLHMPFSFREDREEILYNVIQDQIKGHKSFGVEHRGFGCFEPRVIYVNVTKTEALVDLRNSIVSGMRKNLNLLNADYKDFGFQPHMTIAFRDLKKSLFPSAWDQFRDKTFEESWECSDVVLLKHTGKNWLIHQRFSLV
ncbi:MAG: 2'-5' RNA ligase family protein [Cyclobacteriaceae bacterium]